nr:ABC transporter six-transmembrane domain-containing protein [Pantoea sp. Tr-811]
MKAIALAHPGKLLMTFSLVTLENLLLLAYPLFAGYAVDSILKGHSNNALMYSVVVLSFWVVGAIRRAVGTRTFTRIYAQLAVLIVLDQRAGEHSITVTTARIALAKGFVDFCEKHVPVIFTACISIIGSAGMLIYLQPLPGILCLLSLLILAFCLPSFNRRNQRTHQIINDQLRLETLLIDHCSVIKLKKHYNMLSRLRIALSDREASALSILGAIAATLSAVTIYELSTKSRIQAGHVYAVMTYLWTFVSSLDEAPSLVDQAAHLRNVGKRVRPSYSS